MSVLRRPPRRPVWGLPKSPQVCQLRRPRPLMRSPSPPARAMPIAARRSTTDSLHICMYSFAPLAGRAPPTSWRSSLLIRPILVPTPRVRAPTSVPPGGTTTPWLCYTCFTVPAIPCAVRPEEAPSFVITGMGVASSPSTLFPPTGSTPPSVADRTIRRMRRARRPHGCRQGLALEPGRRHGEPRVWRNDCCRDHGGRYAGGDPGREHRRHWRGSPGRRSGCLVGPDRAWPAAGMRRLRRAEVDPRRGRNAGTAGNARRARDRLALVTAGGFPRHLGRPAATSPGRDGGRPGIDTLSTLGPRRRGRRREPATAGRTRHPSRGAGRRRRDDSPRTRPNPG